MLSYTLRGADKVGCGRRKRREGGGGRGICLAYLWNENYSIIVLSKLHGKDPGHGNSAGCFSSDAIAVPRNPPSIFPSIASKQNKTLSHEYKHAALWWKTILVRKVGRRPYNQRHCCQKHKEHADYNIFLCLDARSFIDDRLWSTLF